MTRYGRHLARQCAVQALYQWQITGQESDQIIRSFIGNDRLTGKHKEYFLALMNAIPLHVDQIDTLIQPHLDRSQERVDPVEEAILRLGTYELQFVSSVPTRVVIDEAVELAKTFGSENGYRYVNGVLDQVAKEVRE